MSTREFRVEKARQLKARQERARLLGDEPEEDPQVLDMRMAQVMQGVTLTWLHYVFKRDRGTAKILLADCPVVRQGAGGAQIYDVAQAAAYLVKPKLDIVKLIGTLKESDLPDELKPKIWQAKLAKQRWEEKAGTLWRGEDVMETFGRTFKAMRETMQLWSDDMAEETNLTEAQRLLLVKKVDQLQASLHNTLIEMAKQRQTKSLAAEAQSEEQDVTELRDA